MLGKQGWLGISWPVEFGGRAWSPLEQLTYIEELERAQAPVGGLSLQAPAIIKYGTDEQRARYLPGILRGEIQFCLGYSEPEAGSDLAALKTSARRDGDGWVIDGTKLWNSGAMHSDYVWLAARTNPNAPRKQDGISVFMDRARAACRGLSRAGGEPWRGADSHVFAVGSFLAHMRSRAAGPTVPAVADQHLAFARLWDRRPDNAEVFGPGNTLRA